MDTSSDRAVATIEGKTQIMTTDLDGPIILFDGLCNLCSASVQFVLQHEKGCKYRFASLQSDVGRALLETYARTEYQNANTIILIDGSVAYYKSTAALRIARSLSFPWPFLSIFLIMPEKLRDWAYDFIGQRRYKWFGKMDACWVPDPAYKDRFLDSE